MFMDRVRDRNRDRNRERNRERNMDRNSERNRDRNRERNRDRNRVMAKEKVRDLVIYMDSIRDRDRVRPAHGYDYFRLFSNIYLATRSSRGVHHYV